MTALADMAPNPRRRVLRSETYSRYSDPYSSPARPTTTRGASLRRHYPRALLRDLRRSGVVEWSDMASLSRRRAAPFALARAAAAF
jgi:hypothetical protein